MNAKTPMLALAALACAFAAKLAFARADAEPQFRAADTNQDGRVSEREHEEHARRMFETMDADRDGFVRAAEMDAAQPKLGTRPAGTGAMSSAEKIRVVDRDGDGKLSAAEHASGSREMFGKMDGDHDGSLSPAEMKAGHERLMKPAR
jgi:hypothetical protein